jgi:molecular chaperone GrpE
VDAQEGATAERGQVEAPVANDPEARITQLEAELDAARAESAEHHDRWLRAAAEFDNFRRRTAREIEETAGRARAEVLLEVVKVLDDVDRALAAGEERPARDLGQVAGGGREVAEGRDAPEDPVVAGIRLIRARLAEVLRRHGVLEIEAEGNPFDPHLHEAVLSVPAGAVPEGHIAQVLERGYWLGERVLRPAKVAVAHAGRA